MKIASCVLALTILGSATVSAQQPAASAKPVAAAPTYMPLDFWQLSNWDYNTREKWEPTPHKAEGTIPAAIQALDGRKVSIYGMVMPLDADKDGAHEIILNASVDACGFGGVPRINEWAFVTLPPGKKTRANPGDELQVQGTLRVKEQVENGVVVGLFSITADSVR